MDRSFLSQAEVVTASRSFVCVRLATYENEAEAKFMRTLFVGRSGEVENTTFAILSPDGQEKLVRTGRSTRQIFTSATEMANTMITLAKKYPPRANEAGKSPPLPVTADVRLGLDVAASDGQPLVVVLASDNEVRTALEARLAKLAWSPEFLGKLTYATASTTKALTGVTGVKVSEGFLLIEPDTFGQKGQLVRQIEANSSSETLIAALRATLAAHTTTVKESRKHIDQGIREGIFWDTRLPIGDPNEAAARARTKQAIDRQQK